MLLRATMHRHCTLRRTQLTQPVGLACTGSTSRAKLCSSITQKQFSTLVLRTGAQTPPNGLRAMPSFGARTPEGDPSLTPSQEPVLERDHEATLTLLLAGVVERRMSIINIQHGPTPADSIGMPVAAWVLGECLLHWAVRWRAAEVCCCTSLL